MDLSGSPFFHQLNTFFTAIQNSRSKVCRIREVCIHLTKSGIEWRYSLIIGLWAKTFSWITFELRIFFNEHNVSREAENASWEPLPRSRPVQSRIRNELCDWKETSNDCSAQICQLQILVVKVLEPATARKIRQPIEENRSQSSFVLFFNTVHTHRTVEMYFLIHP